MDAQNRLYTSEKPAAEDTQRLRETYRDGTDAERERLERDMTDLDSDQAEREIPLLRAYLSQP